MTASTRFTRFQGTRPSIRSTPRSWLHEHAQERLRQALLLRAARAEAAMEPGIAPRVVTAPAADPLGELLLDVPLEPVPRGLVIHPVLPAAAAAEPTVPRVVEPMPPPAGLPIAPDEPAPRRPLARLVPVAGIAAVIVLATLWLVVREWRWLSLPIDRREAIARSLVDRWRGRGAFAELDAQNARQWNPSDAP
jgi:hypothetical protein